VIDNQQRERVVAAAQARRDRERLAAAQADIAALSARVAKLQRNPCYRLLVPPVRRALRLMRAMRGHTTGQGHSAPAEPTWRGLALVIDSEWPQPDRDSGSIDIVLMVQSLRGLGFETILAANTSLRTAARQRARGPVATHASRPRPTPGSRRSIQHLLCHLQQFSSRDVRASIDHSHHNRPALQRTWTDSEKVSRD
jgi:hypothetical protein